MNKNSKWAGIGAIMGGTGAITVAITLIIQGANISSELITLFIGVMVVGIGIKTLNQ